MAEVIKMPKMSDTMEEGVIASWLKKVGDQVSSGDILAEVETDKATMELESYDDGTLLYIGVEEKAAVPVDGVIAIIGEAGENIDALVASIGNGSAAPVETPAAEAPAVAEAAPTAAPAAIDTSGINATVIKMPKMSDTMEEGVIAAWIKKVGDKVSSGDILAEVETDKATMELESYDDGTLLYTAVEAGNGVPVDGVIAIIGEEGADYETLLKAEEAKSAAPTAAAETPATPTETASAPVQASPSSAASAPATAATPATAASNGRVVASPLAKKLAQEKGFDIAQIPGSGDGGRIIKRDVESFVPSAAPVASGASAGGSIGVESFEDIPATQMRKAITKSLKCKSIWCTAFLSNDGN